MIAENNYGYTDPTSVEGKTTTPGFVRVDLDATGNGCHTVWTNTTESAPTVVSKLALANGLVYTYTTDSSGDWYWTALDYRTGQVVYKVLAGNGIGYNNNYAGISISPSRHRVRGRTGRDPRAARRRLHASAGAGPGQRRAEDDAQAEHAAPPTGRPHHRRAAGFTG